MIVRLINKITQYKYDYYRFLILYSFNLTITIMKISILLFLLSCLYAKNLIINHDFSNNSDTVARGGWKGFNSLLGWTCTTSCQIHDCRHIAFAPINCTEYFMDLDSSKIYERLNQIVRI